MVVEGVWQRKIQIRNHVQQLFLLNCKRDILDHNGRRNDVVIVGTQLITTHRLLHLTQGLLNQTALVTTSQRLHNSAGNTVLCLAHTSQCFKSRNTRRSLLFLGNPLKHPVGLSKRPKKFAVTTRCDDSSKRIAYQKLSPTMDLQMRPRKGCLFNHQVAIR